MACAAHEGCAPAAMPKHKQLHVWLTDTDHEFVTQYARERDQTAGAVVRRLIRSLQQAQRQRSPGSSSQDDPSTQLERSPLA